MIDLFVQPPCVDSLGRVHPGDWFYRLLMFSSHSWVTMNITYLRYCKSGGPCSKASCHKRVCRLWPETTRDRPSWLLQVTFAALRRHVGDFLVRRTPSIRKRILQKTFAGFPSISSSAIYPYSGVGIRPRSSLPVSLGLCDRTECVLRLPVLRDINLPIFFSLFVGYKLRYKTKMVSITHRPWSSINLDAR